MGCISEAWPSLTPPCAIYELRLPFGHLPVRKLKSSIRRPDSVGGYEPLSGFS